MSRVALVAVSFIVALACVTITYAFLIEPNWLEITHYSVNAAVRSRLRLAHLTDLHIHREGSLERKILESLERERPDLIVITGDTVDDGQGIEVAGNFLRKLNAPLGVWAVKGNWEHWKPVPDETAFFAAAGVTLLVNQKAQPRPDLVLNGFDDSLAGAPLRSRATLRMMDQGFCIALFHSPQYFDELHGDCPLALSGHTHGGQVRLPLIGPLWLPPGSGRYISGWYENSNRKMYVSRGLGTTLLRIRFLARPELVYLTLVPESKETK